MQEIGGCEGQRPGRETGDVKEARRGNRVKVNEEMKKSTTWIPPCLFRFQAVNRQQTRCSLFQTEHEQTRPGHISTLQGGKFPKHRQICVFQNRLDLVILHCAFFVPLGVVTVTGPERHCNGPIYWWCDSSPQMGTDWLLSIYDFISKPHVTQCFRAAETVCRRGCAKVGDTCSC